MIEDPITADPCEESPAPHSVAGVLSGVLLFFVAWAVVFVVMGWVL